MPWWGATTSAYKMDITLIFAIQKFSKLIYYLINLIVQVIQAVRDQKDTLKELSKIARRGYISHGLGAVKCFYPNPEAAEKFLAEGLSSLGELTFVRWQDLLPTEMGPMLYKELVEMCQNYNSETKFVLYISLCVVSETPASGAVKWERQLVSRCAKLRLSKDLNFVGKHDKI